MLAVTARRPMRDDRAGVFGAAQFESHGPRHIAGVDLESVDVADRDGIGGGGETGHRAPRLASPLFEKSGAFQTALDGPPIALEKSSSSRIVRLKRCRVKTPFSNLS